MHVLSELKRESQGPASRMQPIGAPCRPQDAWFRALSNGVEELVFVLDERGAIVDANPTCEQVLGRPLAELSGNLLTDLLLPDSRRRTQNQLSALAQGTPTSFTMLLGPKDAPAFVLDVMAHRIEAQGGCFLLVCQPAERGTDAHAWRRETHHRVKNHMQIISSLLRLHVRSTDDDVLKLRLAECQCQVHAISLVHELLHGSPSCTSVDLGQFAKRLAGTIAATHGVAPHIDVHVELRATNLGPDHAVTCGLALNELISNSFLHAFEGRSRGNIVIGGGIRAGHVVVGVSDDGIGLPSDFDARRSCRLGLELVRGLIEKQLGGTLKRVPCDRGTTFAFRFPLAPPTRVIP